MVTSLHQRLARLFLIVAVALGLGGAGLAHDPARLAAETGLQDDRAAIAAFLDAGGELSDICGDGPGHGQAAGVLCQACLLAATAHLPPAPADALPADHAAPAETVLPAGAPDTGPRLVAHLGARAPPLSA